MSDFSLPIALFMSSPVITVSVDDTLQRAEESLRSHRISSVAVVDAQRRPVGVLSRTDLLKLGRVNAGRWPKSALLTLPDQPVKDAMTPAITTVSRDATVRAAARLMLERHQHRVFVAEEGSLVGVFSTKDLMLALAQEGLLGPISELMTSPVITVRAEEPVALAAERLELAKVAGVVVMENGWPVGLFTQVEALLFASLPRDTETGDAMTQAMLCLDVTTPLRRAAASAAATSARRVIVTHDRDVKGILSGLDFARAAC